MGNIVKKKKESSQLKIQDNDADKEYESIETKTSNSKNTNQNNIESNKQLVEFETNAADKPPDTICRHIESVKRKNSNQPYFLVGLEDIIVPEGNTVALECCIYCLVPGEISWYKDDSLIKNGTMGYILEKEENGWNRLIIPDAR